MPPTGSPAAYRGRIAPSPSGLLHLGHASTFWTAQQRARQRGGILVLRVDDLDEERCKERFTDAAVEDLKWLGIEWAEGPDCGGVRGPYLQSQRQPLYREAFERLRALGLLYPCTCSRKEVAQALRAPHAIDEEPVYPGTCRPATPTAFDTPRSGINWRFRIARSEPVEFEDSAMGTQRAYALRDFGDFLVWRKDDLPSYQLASAVDDMHMEITEVVRGADLVTSTFRQILLWREMEYTLPDFHHCPLLRDAQGKRLAKRDDAQALRTFRDEGLSAQEVLRRIQEALHTHGEHAFPETCA
jgi:glutamyl/glutaminyl-tRNA synthetase